MPHPSRRAPFRSASAAAALFLLFSAVPAQAEERNSIEHFFSEGLKDWNALFSRRSEDRKTLIQLFEEAGRGVSS